MLDGICQMCNSLAEHGTLNVDQRQALQTRMNRLALAGALNVEALRDWERAVVVGAGASRFREGVQATLDSVDAVARGLAPLGIRNPTALVMDRKIGGWELDDFREQAMIEKTFDVTGQLAGPGTYTVTFQYTGGWNGAGTYRAALVAEPKDGGGAAVEVSADEHQGSTGNQSKDNVYSLRLESYDPTLCYHVLARLRGTRPQDQQPGRTGCSGAVYLYRERDPDWQVQIMHVPPMSE